MNRDPLKDEVVELSEELLESNGSDFDLLGMASLNSSPTASTASTTGIAVIATPPRINSPLPSLTLANELVDLSTIGLPETKVQPHGVPADSLASLCINHSTSPHLQQQQQQQQGGGEGETHASPFRSSFSPPTLFQATNHEMLSSAISYSPIPTSVSATTSPHHDHHGHYLQYGNGYTEEGRRGMQSAATYTPLPLASYLIRQGIENDFDFDFGIGIGIPVEDEQEDSCDPIREKRERIGIRPFLPYDDDDDDDNDDDDDDEDDEDSRVIIAEGFQASSTLRHNRQMRLLGLGNRTIPPFRRRVAFLPPIPLETAKTIKVKQQSRVKEEKQVRFFTNVIRHEYKSY